MQGYQMDMERQDYIDQINDLKGYVKQLLGMIDTLKQTLDSVTASNKRNEELVVKLTAQMLRRKTSAHCRSELR